MIQTSMKIDTIFMARRIVGWLSPNNLPYLEQTQCYKPLQLS